MANIAFGSNYFLFSKFSSFPKTSKIEQGRTALKNEFDEFNAFKSSDELIQFEKMGKYLESLEHKSLLDRVNKGKTVEEEKNKSYENQKKSKKIKSHVKFRNSQALKDFISTSESSDYKKYTALKTTVSSAEYNSKKGQLRNAMQAAKKKDDKSGQKTADVENQLNELLQQEKDFAQLSKTSAIKHHKKLQNSQKYKNYLAFEKSKEWANYLVLEKYVISTEHKEKLSKLTTEQAKENNKIKSHQEFKNGKKYKWYQELKGSKKFDGLKKWKVVFEDDFSIKSLDTEKWMTRYYWGDKLVNDAYALEFDQAFPTDGQNIEINNTLKILTKKEKVEGKQWKVPFGFVPQEFDYTTGLISSAKSFRLRYGKVEAKIKVNFAKPVNYNFWMASEKNLPHVDILKLHSHKSRVDSGITYGNIRDSKGPTKKSAEFKGLDVSQDFFIYTFEWTKDKLTWKINDVVVNEQTKEIPKEEMYLVFSSGITNKNNGTGLPASMEIDWVRCYQD